MTKIDPEIEALVNSARAKAEKSGRVPPMEEPHIRAAEVYGNTKTDEEMRDSKNKWRFRRCGVPVLYAKSGFDDYEDNPKLVARMKALSNEDSVIISGNTGCGKTHLAVALMAASGLRENEMIFAECIQFMDTIKDSYRDKAPVPTSELMKRHLTIPLLVIDDLGAEALTDNSREKIAQLIKGREANVKRTIITTNLTIEQLESRYESRTASRLSTMEHIKIATMPDYRKKVSPKKKSGRVVSFVQSDKDTQPSEHNEDKARKGHEIAKNQANM